ncbi:MAG: glycosyltransferase [Candidatus Dependentiae bacterium]|nr:glycosyltransferase [Candidatus Dependentiae bacterium]
MKRLLLSYLLLSTITVHALEIEPGIFIPPHIYVHAEQPLDNAKRYASLPYITGDTFRSMAQFFVDELRLPINPLDINNGDIVFVKTDLLDYFFTELHPHIKSDYIIISHNSDDSAPGNYAHMLDDNKIIAWFGQNPDTVDHPKFFPIPIGLANPHWPTGNTTVFDLLIPHAKNIEKNTLLYLNILPTHPERQGVAQLFSDKSFCYKASRKALHDYVLELAQSNFILSPRGNGLDCHRTWEALLMGSYPVVRTSPLDSIYQDLPVVIVNDWQEVTQEFLNQKYEEMRLKTYNNEKIYFAYWFNKIKECQDNYLKKAKASHLPKNFNPDFHQAMKSKTYDVAFAHNDPFWKNAKTLYDNYIANFNLSGQPRIPKIIHQIWVGSPLPEKYKSLIETWKKNHPDWVHILWTDKALDALGLINKKQYDAATNMGEKSDIARYELLYRFGGLYVDTDFECLKSFDVFNHSCSFYTGLAPDKELVVYVALIGATPGHPILKKCVERISTIRSNCTHPDDILQNTGPYFLTRCIAECLDVTAHDTVLFPISYFYPWPNYSSQQKSRPEIESWIKPESYGIHHWHVSWAKW